jgi:tetratricopeptide (TPR) repeat protein
LVFAIVAGTSLAYALGARLPGQTSSGNSAASLSTTNAAGKALAERIDSLQQQVNAKPDDYDLRLQLSHAYEANGDLQNALKQSDAAITIDGNRPEAHANLARLIYLGSTGAPNATVRSQLVSQALAGFNQAIAVGPDYADAYYFRAVLYAQSMRDDARAQVDLQNYLLKAPDGTWAEQARQLLADVTKALETPSTTVPPTSTTRKK